MKHFLALPLLVMLAGCAAAGYEASYPTCNRLAAEDAKLIRWLAVHHREVEASGWGNRDPRVADILAQKRRLYAKRRAAFCI